MRRFVLFLKQFKIDGIYHTGALLSASAEEKPITAYEVNAGGTFNVLELARRHSPRHLMIASTSSIYGANPHVPFRESDRAVHPVSLYAATKMSTELIAHSYSHLFDIATTAFRFFTVYGPWGRPDMSPWLFSSAILEGRPIDVFNFGQMQRDFTYVDDIALGTLKVLDHVPTRTFEAITPRPDRSAAPFKVFNIGNHAPIQLMSFIEAIEQSVGREAIKNFMPMQDGDVPATHADVEELAEWTGFRPAMPVPEGIQRFVAWYRDYYKV